MELSGYPAFAGLDQLPPRISFERAIWGKVDGARSDFRWIARSSGFKGHLQHLERDLTIGLEEQPRKAPFWRWWNTSCCYYAVSCYESRARDADGRSGFMEKQIIEWRPEGVPAMVGALYLLREAANFEDNLATTSALDTRWSDLTFSLPLESKPCQVTSEGLQGLLEKGRQDLSRIPDRELAHFFYNLGATGQKAFAASPDGPLTPEALAVLLLPLDREKADRISLGAWIPSQKTDANALRNWDGLVCDPKQKPPSSGEPAPDIQLQNVARRQVQILRGFSSAVQFLLDFADGPKRWLDTVTPSDRAITIMEVDQLKEAIQRVEREAADPAGLEEPMKSARQRHIRSKANVILAASMVLAPDWSSLPDGDDQVTTILQRWQRNAQGRFRERVDQILQTRRPISNRLV